jgi:integrase
MPRPRKPENRGLPARWRKLHGAIYYQVPPGLEEQWDGKRLFRLGSSLPEAYRAWADRIAVTAQPNRRTIADLLDRYLAEVVPTKAPATQEGNVLQISVLRRRLGDQPLEAIEPQHVYQYIDTRVNEKTGRKSPISARREIEVLSHAYTKAVEWGYLKAHPFKGEVRLQGEKPRDRYVEDWEVVEVLALQSRQRRGSVNAIQAYIRIKLMTGMARGDLLRLRVDQHLKEDGIHVQRHKTAGSTGKRTVYEWTPELREAVDQAKRVRPALSPFLFCKRSRSGQGAGEGYINEKTGRADGWDSMWQRFMDRVLAETKVTERFTEHDLRAKCASDAESLEHARALLAHADARTTQQIYRRKPERVRPVAR